VRFEAVDWDSRGEEERREMLRLCEVEKEMHHIHRLLHLASRH